jgi:tripartite-type tricarboxylate transporter receptor subunit TctC
MSVLAQLAARLANKLATLSIAIAAGAMALPWAAYGQEFPSRPITILVPWPAGGSTDQCMRAFAAVAAHIERPGLPAK